MKFNSSVFEGVNERTYSQFEKVSYALAPAETAARVLVDCVDCAGAGASRHHGCAMNCGRHHTNRGTDVCRVCVRGLQLDHQQQRRLSGSSCGSSRPSSGGGRMSVVKNLRTGNRRDSLSRGRGGWDCLLWK